jgi:hypothetical protein
MEMLALFISDECTAAAACAGFCRLDWKLLSDRWLGVHPRGQVDQYDDPLHRRRPKPDYDDGSE